MKPRSLPLRGPASCFTATGLTSSLHSWADKAESSFPSILALLAGCSLIPTSGRTQRGQPGKAGSGHCEPPLLCPSQVGRGLWPGAGWGGWGGWGGGRPPPSAPTLLCVQPAEAGGCREEAAPASAAPLPLLLPTSAAPRLCCPLASAARSLPSPQPPGLPCMAIRVPGVASIPTIAFVGM